MILGTGIDLVDIARIRRALTRHGERFLSKILLPAEIAYCLEKAEPALSVAARFAAKEAVVKAFGTGIGEQIGWHDIEIVRNGAGAPSIELHGRGRELLEKRGASTVHVSLSHVQEYAAAFAIVER